MEVGNVNSKHFVLALKVMEGYRVHSQVLNLFLIFSSILQVKSVLDPCEDDNEGVQDDFSAGDDSMQQNEYYDTDSEVNEDVA